jgi:hypothetical protein
MDRSSQHWDWQQQSKKDHGNDEVDRKHLVLFDQQLVKHAAD